MHSIYEIKVKNKIYYGYTSRDPLERLKEHLDIAKRNKWKHKSLLYPALVSSNFKYDFRIVEQFQTEFDALVKEIKSIRATLKTIRLNLSEGGEGSKITVKVREVNGELKFRAIKRQFYKPKHKTTKRLFIKRFKKRRRRR